MLSVVRSREVKGRNETAVVVLSFVPRVALN